MESYYVIYQKTDKVEPENISSIGLKLVWNMSKTVFDFMCMCLVFVCVCVFCLSNSNVLKVKANRSIKPWMFSGEILILNYCKLSHQKVNNDVGS